MKTKVAVLMGGRSLEREVSLKSGQRVADALGRQGYDVTTYDVDENLVASLKSNAPDVIFIALHGKYGEDGTVQELLEILDIPYTGPSVYASIVGFDKVLSKMLFEEASIPTPQFFALSAGTFKEMGASAILPDIVDDVGIPLVVKPAGQGSALGVKIVKTKDDLPAALIGALSYDEKVLIEKFVKGREVTVGIIGTETDRVALPIVEIQPKKDFFDFESMYTAGMTDYFVPARLSTEEEMAVKETALKVFDLLKCRDIARVDLIVGEDGVPYVLELNTCPGLTETSLLPMSAKAAGMEFDELIGKIAGFALSRRKA